MTIPNTFTLNDGSSDLTFNKVRPGFYMKDGASLSAPNQITLTNNVPTAKKQNRNSFATHTVDHLVEYTDNDGNSYYLECKIVIKRPLTLVTDAQTIAAVNTAASFATGQAPEYLLGGS